VTELTASRQDSAVSENIEEVAKAEGLCWTFADFDFIDHPHLQAISEALPSRQSQPSVSLQKADASILLILREVMPRLFRKTSTPRNGQPATVVSSANRNATKSVSF
jgi:hypothetical protein